MKVSKKRLGIIALVGVLVLAALMAAQPEPSEVESVERQAKRDVASLILIRTKQVMKSPRLMLELALMRTNDPVAFLDGRFEKSLERLKELGALEDRKFLILQTNGKPARVDVMKMFETGDVLWRVTGPRTNGVFEVRARVKAMGAWEKLEREYAVRQRQ
jgi:hypothetical protein